MNIYYFIEGISVPQRLSSPCTLRTLLRCYWDIQSVPRRSFFEILSWFAVNELEKEKLEEFVTPEGQEELYSYCNRPRRTIIEVMTSLTCVYIYTVHIHVCSIIFYLFYIYFTGAK